MPSQTQLDTKEWGDTKLTEAAKPFKDTVSALILHTEPILQLIDGALGAALRQWEKEELSPAADPENPMSDAYVHPMITR